ncbi:MAG: polymer-forming cytoskeletal protein [Flavobacteriales bacterium]|nr:polymer-forming cytoskeletal protein [Flavobacteriales bacterium]
MFNRNSGNDSARTSSTAMPNHINSDTVIEGSIRAKGNLRIDGTLKGDLECQGRLVVGATGIIDGDIRCENAEVEGTLKANISVTDLLTLKSTAKVHGDIMTKKLAIEPGAAFTGSCSMGTGAVIKDLSDAGKNDRREEQPRQKTA